MRRLRTKHPAYRLPARRRRRRRLLRIALLLLAFNLVIPPYVRLGFSTLYAHLDAARTRAGRPVVKWARIGSAGQSGRATGPHLHFEVRWLGRRLPPGPFLAIDSARRTLWRLVRPG